MKIDLHCHSTYSDGSLTPLELLKKAEEQDIKILAITDHDNIDAHHELATVKTPIQLITGIEFSSYWQKTGIHIVGLYVNIHSRTLATAIKKQQLAREDRAKIISKKLEKLGLENAYEQIKSKHPNKQIGRPNFAALLVSTGICKDHNQAYKKYLGAGKIGDVKNQWLDYQEIIRVITAAGGMAILAHPLYYKLTNSKLHRLLQDFKKSGGQALEVINGYQNPDLTQYLIKLAQKFNFKASLGSDFHAPNRWCHLGCDSAYLQELELVC
ncbi:MAG TPA: PHP domain-containing protein [Oceanospirillales bacterium]|nr:PHP domain-containing protein [Oceanospirillales bacterium]